MFYTYFHTRNDTGEVFYVGKGVGNRLLDCKRRNPYWSNIANKCGFTAHLAARWSTEKEAFEHERFLISCFKTIGVHLSNMTDGGDGVAGFKASPEQVEANRLRGLAQMTEERRQRLREKAIANATPKARAESSDRAKALWSDDSYVRKAKESARRRWSSEEERKKQSERTKAYSMDPEVRARLSAQSKGKLNSPEARAKISAANKGKVVSEETKAKMRSAWVIRRASKNVNPGTR